MPCYSRVKDGGTMFVRGKLGPHCGKCNWVGEFLCDFPVGDGKTCDMPLCEDHASEVAPDLHYCPVHFDDWTKFRDGGGVKRVLENVVPYKKVEP